MSNFITHLKEKLNENVVQIEFTKKDGSNRIMICTRNFSKIPKESHPKEDTNKIANENILKVWDTEKSAWRSVRLDSIQNWITLTPSL